MFFCLITAQRAGLSAGTCKKGAFALERLLNMARGKQARQKRSLIKFHLKERQTGEGEGEGGERDGGWEVDRKG